MSIRSRRRRPLSRRIMPARPGKLLLAALVRSAWLWATLALTVAIAYITPEGSAVATTAGVFILFGDGRWWTPIRDPRLAVPVAAAGAGLIYGAEPSKLGVSVIVAAFLAVSTKMLGSWERWAWWQSRLAIRKAWPEINEHAGWPSTKLMQIRKLFFPESNEARGVSLAVRWPRGAVPPFDEIGMKLSSVLGRPLNNINVRGGKHAGEVVVEVESPRDFLSKPIPYPGVPERQSSKPTRIPLGLTDKGSVLYLDWQHTLFGGMSGSGKSSGVQAVLAHAAPWIASGDIELWIADPKEGVELGMWANAATVFAEPPDIDDEDEAAEATAELWVEFMRQVHGVMRDRLRQIGNGQRQWTRADGPMVLVVIDEARDVFADPASITRAIKVAEKARAAGVVMMVATQHPEKAAVPTQLGNNIPQKVGYKAENPVHAHVITGGCSAEAPLHKLPPAKPATAGHVHARGSTGSWTRARTYWLDNKTVNAAAELARGNRQPGARLVPPSRHDDTPEPPEDRHEGASEPTSYGPPRDGTARGRIPPARPARLIRPTNQLAALVQSGVTRAGDVWDAVAAAGPEGLRPMHGRKHLGNMSESHWTSTVAALEKAGLVRRGLNGRRVYATHEREHEHNDEELSA